MGKIEINNLIFDHIEHTGDKLKILSERYSNICHICDSLMGINPSYIRSIYLLNSDFIKYVRNMPSRLGNILLLDKLKVLSNKIIPCDCMIFTNKLIENIRKNKELIDLLMEFNR